MPRSKLDAFHVHEVADRAMVLCDVIESHILGHALVKRRRSLVTDAKEAQRLLFRIAATCGPVKKLKP